MARSLRQPTKTQSRLKRYERGQYRKQTPTLEDAESSMRRQASLTFGAPQPRDVSMPGHGMAFGPPTLPRVAPSFLLPEGRAGQEHVGAANRAAEQLQQLADEQLKRREGIVGRELGEARGDIQADLQRQLEQLGMRGERGFQDMEREVRERWRQLPIQLRQHMGKQAGRGAAFSGATEFGQEEIERATKRAVGRRQQQYNRLMQDIKRSKGAAREQAKRALRDAQQEAEEAKQRISDVRRERELERQYKESQQQAKAAESLAARQREARREAQQWIGNRVNQLVNSGYPEGQAQSVAISEARQYYSGVPETYLSGAVRASAPERNPEQERIRKNYGVDISPERARNITPGKRRELRKGDTYRQTARDLRAYLPMAGGGASLGEFLDYLGDTGREAGMSSSEIRQKIREDAHILSLVWADAIRGT